MAESSPPAARWYSGVTPYQWLVLVVASAGWVFDAFEGQLFNITRDNLLQDLLGPNDPEAVIYWGDVLLAAFLLGGTVGGVIFGSLADRFGRKPTMAVTILFYSIFSGLTYFATELWHVAILRFLVALGVGGEWAVAAALVAEVFPATGRAQASGIFHSTSILGTWLAAAAGLLVGAEWRYAYLIGVIPALLVLAVRASIVEPEGWRKAEKEGRSMGSFRDLFGDPRWRHPAILGVLFATVGLGTFWGVFIAGQNLTSNLLLRTGMNPAEASQRAKIAYGFIQSAGAAVGMFSFGPLAAWLGRRPTFAIMHIGALIIVPATCYLPATYTQLLLMLPLYGFFVLGIHAGYAVYFPELFPGHLRATGCGVCFNGGRLLSAPVLILSGTLKRAVGLHEAISLLSLLFVAGLVLLWFLPETKGRPLPE